MGFPDRVRLPSPIAINCADSETWRRRNDMYDERKVQVVFGVIVAPAVIVIAAALVMNAMVG